MYEAYVLLKISRSMHAGGIVERLRTIPGIEEAELLYGDYDAIIKIKATKLHEVENLIVDRISAIRGVVSSMTLLCVDEKVLE